MPITLIQNSFGNFLVFDQDYATKAIKDNKFLDFSLKEQIDIYVKKDSICIDIGANLGFISVYMAKKCKKVYSIEPQNVVFKQLCGNLFINECFNVVPLKIAGAIKRSNFSIADKNKQEILVFHKDYNNIDNIGGISLEEKIDGDIIGDRIENYIDNKDRIDFIKCDAQGGDYDALKGLENIIVRDKPIIVFEYEKSLSEKCYGRKWLDYVEFFNHLNYKILFLEDGNTLAKYQE